MMWLERYGLYGINNKKRLIAVDMLGEIERAIIFGCVIMVFII